ncbi:MAG: hypothetical protein K6G84_09355 [Lachnospiraceae bacterium]|nr:hypothetical protein [Lachnospiraceae bacterium]
MNIIRILENLITESGVFSIESGAAYEAASLELCCPIKGSIDLGGEIIPRGNVVIFLPNERYVLSGDEKSVVFKISCDMHLLIDSLGYPERISGFNGKAFDAAEKIGSVVRNCMNSYLSKYDDDNITMAVSLLSAFDLMLKPVPASELTDRQRELFDSIIRYIDSCNTEPRLDETAENVGVTPQYLTTFWKKATGESFSQYLKKNKGSKESLHKQFETDKSIVSENLVKLNYLYSCDILNEFLIDFGKSTSNKNEDSKLNTLTIIPDKYQRIDTVWKRLINLGYASDLVDGRILHGIERTQREIGFEYGRICRLLDLIDKYSIEGKVNYSFRKIFEITDIMLSNHILPFIELSNKQFRIQFTATSDLTDLDKNDPNEYLEYVISVLPAFLKESINRYGYNNVKKWRFEIGYPPYIFADPEKAKEFPARRYCPYFSRIKDIIKHFLPECMIGGPGYNNWIDIEDFDAICEDMERYNASADFVTAYIYPVVKEDMQLFVSEDPATFEERLVSLKSRLNARGDKRELWITEFNSNLSSRTLINDSNYQAAFLINTVRSAMQHKIAALGYYILFDKKLRYADNLDLLFGGWGLFTDTNLPKASYHAYEILAMLGRNLIKTGDNYIAASSSDTHIQLLLFSYDHITSKYCRENMTKEDVRSEYMVADDEGREFEVVIEHLTAGRYEVETYNVNRFESNILYEWFEMGFATPSRLNEKSAFAKRCEMMPNFDIYNVENDNILNIKTRISDNGIKLMDIRLQQEEM